MPQTIKGAAEPVAAAIADRHEARTVVPSMGGAGINVGAQSVAANEVVVDALECGVGTVAGHAQIIGAEDMVAMPVDGQKARARAVGEVDPACKAVGGAGSQPDMHLPAGCGIVAAIGCTGVHHQLGVARGDHHGVDVDVASRCQC